jgi:hypothetical protein
VRRKPGFPALLCTPQIPCAQAGFHASGGLNQYLPIQQINTFCLINGFTF